MSRRVEFSYGRQIVCGHIFPTEEIITGQRWMSSAGHIVTIDKIVGDEIYYIHKDGNQQNKDSFNFQCRYCLVID